LGIYWNSTGESFSFQSIAIKDDIFHSGVARSNCTGLVKMGGDTGQEGIHGRATNHVAICMFFLSGDRRYA